MDEEAAGLVDAVRADRFCLLSEPSKCLLPASASPLFY